jgi:prepilin-type N-terminal cleavage/methylation domain-containing protein
MQRLARGFTMIELLMVLAIGTMIAAAIVSILLSQMQLTTTQNRNIINQQDLRSTLQFMADEIQLMGQGTIEPYVFQATTDSFSFVGDLDGNADPDLVHYQVISGALHRTYSSSTDGGVTWTQLGEDDLLSDVQNMVFTYYAEGNAIPADVSEISSVEIRLTLNPAANGTAFTSGKLRTPEMVQRITVRNRLIN